MASSIQLELQFQCSVGYKKCTCHWPGKRETWLFSRFSTGWSCGLHANWTKLTRCVPAVVDGKSDAWLRLCTWVHGWGKSGPRSMGADPGQGGRRARRLGGLLPVTTGAPRCPCGLGRAPGALESSHHTVAASGSLSLLPQDGYLRVGLLGGWEWVQGKQPGGQEGVHRNGVLQADLALDSQKEIPSVCSIPDPLQPSLCFLPHPGPKASSWSLLSYYCILPSASHLHLPPSPLIPLLAFLSFSCSWSCCLWPLPLLLPPLSSLTLLLLPFSPFLIFFSSLPDFGCLCPPLCWLSLPGQMHVPLWLFGDIQRVSRWTPRGGRWYPACTSHCWLHTGHPPSFVSVWGTGLGGRGWGGGCLNQRLGRVAFPHPVCCSVLRNLSWFSNFEPPSPSLSVASRAPPGHLLGTHSWCRKESAILWRAHRQLLLKLGNFPYPPAKLGCLRSWIRKKERLLGVQFPQSGLLLYHSP